MPNLFKIINSAYRYTRNHKFLWFFGIFFTGSGVLNISRYVDTSFPNVHQAQHRLTAIYNAHPASVIWLILGALFSTLLLFLLGALSRAVITQAAVDLERGQKDLHFAAVLKKAAPQTWKIFLINLLMNLSMGIVFLWLFGPVFYILSSRGFNFSALFLILVAFGIYLPFFLILSLVNIFSCNFVVAFKMNLGKALTAGFDLFSRLWNYSIALLVLLFVLYCLIFFVSASALGAVGLLAYFLVFLLKSLAVPVISSVFGTIIVLAVLALVFVNAVLNVFINIAWTIFFLEMINSNPLPKEKPLAAEPARSVAV